MINVINHAKVLVGVKVHCFLKLVLAVCLIQLRTTNVTDTEDTAYVQDEDEQGTYPYRGLESLIIHYTSFIVDCWTTDYAVCVIHCGLINSGGASSGNSDLAEAVTTAVINKRAGGHGLITGRKAFQRPMKEGVEILNSVQDVYLEKEITIA